MCHQKVWFQNRHAKDNKALCKRVQHSTQQGSASAHSSKISVFQGHISQGLSQVFHPMEKPMHSAEDGQPPPPEPHPVEQSSITKSPFEVFLCYITQSPLPKFPLMFNLYRQT
ncbi:uncharacterized protein BJ212DRAFT_1484532 [Suillus subaureus]|uniref:Uncharacterized protein n=1 Tax=Suillus subaureus TaxID=48587 RepID=A0A9P7E2M8_9AGAM|nr:uncharacterized protein BJ212DRAFT_1484532 [Suillus subaureus]KAG1809415.1 hypothetical protein BJ212DRAFT_1484532 [Suillus subaureus]